MLFRCCIVGHNPKEIYLELQKHLYVCQLKNYKILQLTKGICNALGKKYIETKFT